MINQGNARTETMLMTILILMQKNDHLKLIPEMDEADPKIKNSSLHYLPFVTV